ncbi:hypothetical protein FHX37_0628 [Haloactinospora alba]|uniref:DUF2637 domain-containing protein n=1 Tax=Haloactinospora alba TaxID=405555 RepID=A0A543NFX9_9ACTN|nr:hypothetical protein [Haloactinospora alba]TQN30746.1 hypothetical protein FHX37_0628 [Haloactinospora alba]
MTYTDQTTATGRVATVRPVGRWSGLGLYVLCWTFAGALFLEIARGWHWLAETANFAHPWVMVFGAEASALLAVATAVHRWVGGLSYWFAWVWTAAMFGVAVSAQVGSHYLMGAPTGRAEVVISTAVPALLVVLFFGSVLLVHRVMEWQATLVDPRLNQAEPAQVHQVAPEPAEAEPELGQLAPEPEPEPAQLAPGVDSTTRKAQRLDQVRGLLVQRPDLTAQQVADDLGCSLTSGKRYLRAVRSG